MMIYKRTLSVCLSLMTPLFLFSSLWLAVRPAEAATSYEVGTDCLTIQACIDLASAGDEVLIPAGTYVESLTLGKAVTLTGANEATTWIFPPVGRVLLVTSTAVTSDTIIQNLLLARGDVSGGNVCALSDLSNCGGGVLIAGEASPTLRRVTIQANRAYYGGGIYVTRSAGVTLENVTLLDNEATLAGGGGVFYGATTILSSRFESNESGSSGGGASFSATFPNYPKFPVLISDTVFVDNTAVCTSAFCFLNGGGANIFELDATIINSRFENNVCSSGTGGCTGGGLAHSQALNNVTLQLQNSDFINNQAQAHGGGVKFDARTDDFLIVVGGEFHQNESQTGEGGGLWVRDATVQITGTRFVSNTAFELGGGFYVLGTAVISQATFQQNSVISGSGGGLAIEFIRGLTMTDTVVQSNTAAFNGGGLYTAVDATISGGRFSGNQALGGDSSGNPEGGGGIFATRALTLTDVLVADNLARLNGGGLMMLNGFPLHVVGGHFERNEAQGQASLFTRGGGGLYTVGDVSISGTLFISNTAVLTNSFSTLNLGGAGFIFGAAVFDQIEAHGNRSYSGGGAFFVDKTVVVTNSQFISNTAVGGSGGAVQANGAVTLTAGTFERNTSGSSGGGLSAGGDLTLTDTTFLSNTAQFSGGGVALFGGIGGVTVTIAQADFAHNVASSGGAANISVGIGGQLTIAETNFQQNSASGNGGALALSQGVIVGGLIVGNEAAFGGGGVQATGLLIITGTQILSNTAVGNGGGINSNSNVLLTNATVQGNASTGGSGGGVWGNSDAVLTDTQVLSNTAVLDGGGVYARLGFNSHLTRVRLVNNAAGRNGGGLYAARRVQSDDSFWIGNTAVRGGAVAITGTSGTTPMTFTNSVMSRNTATVNGGAIYLNTPRPFVLRHATLSADQMRPESGVHLVTGTVDLLNTIVSSYTVGVVNVSGTLTTTHLLFHVGSTAVVGGVTDVGGQNQMGNPLFVNAGLDQLQLVSGSPALDTAVVSGVGQDVIGVSRPQGSAPDRGAYEGAHTPTAVSLSSVSASAGVREGGLLGLVVLLGLVTAVVKRDYG